MSADAARAPNRCPTQDSREGRRRREQQRDVLRRIFFLGLDESPMKNSGVLISEGMTFRLFGKSANFLLGLGILEFVHTGCTDSLGYISSRFFLWLDRIKLEGN